MIHRTLINPAPAEVKILHSDPVALIGSCFASEIGEMMKKGKMKTLINPYGTVYNPASIASTIEMIVDGKVYTENDLFHYNNKWVSLAHYTGFSSEDPVELTERINKANSSAREFLSGAKFLFITFGTARIYKLRETSRVVSNCHKLPASLFVHSLLGVDEITFLWFNLAEKIRKFNPSLQLIFTISPVRHWKDGAHGNQVSKSVLFLAVEELIRKIPGASYFPAYEILMDDLRDYRYYADDMLHPSGKAVEYIWDLFTASSFDPGSLQIWKEANSVLKASGHRFMTDSRQARKEFAESGLRAVSSLSGKAPWIDFSDEISYFNDIINNS